MWVTAFCGLVTARSRLSRPLARWWPPLLFPSTRSRRSPGSTLTGATSCTVSCAIRRAPSQHLTLPARATYLARVLVPEFVNAACQITGFYIDQGGVSDGFLRTSDRRCEVEPSHDGR